MPAPYISREPNELIRAADWNNIQVQAREEIQGHGHTGADDGAQLTTNALADGSVTTAKLAAGAVTTAQLAANAVTTAQVLDGAITTAKIADGSITMAKLAAGVGATLPDPLAVNITGSTVESVPVAPIFDHLSMTLSRQSSGIVGALANHDNIQVAPQLTDLVSLFAANVPGGGSVTSNAGRMLARALAVVIDNVPRTLIEHFGSVAPAHDAVAEYQPSYLFQLDVLSDLAGGDVMGPALELVQQIEGEPSRVTRTFLYAFATDLEAMFVSYGGQDPLVAAISAAPTMGQLTLALSPTFPTLLAGRLRPVGNAMVVRLDPPTPATGGAMMIGEAELGVGFTSNIQGCVFGLGTETLPPPPLQTTFVAPSTFAAGDFVATTRSAMARRSMFYLPAEEGSVRRTARLWAVSYANGAVGGSHHLLHARVDVRHALLRPYSAVTVIGAGNAEEWNDVVIVLPPPFEPEPLPGGDPIA